MADNVIVRVPEQQFIKGEDGYSPEVTIEDITHGHRVTITDEDHPTGQSFNVMDGDSAYEQAVAGGYEGTETQFNEDLANFKFLSYAATSAASDANTSAQSANRSELRARSSERAAEDAAAAALIRMNSAATSAQAAEDASSFFTSTILPNAVNTINSTRDQAVANVNVAKSTAVQNVQTEGATQITAVQTESATQQAAVQQKGDDVLESIPSDYTELSEDVDDLKSAVATKAQMVYEAQSGTIVSFSAYASDLPLDELTVDIELSQEGSGTPAPDNSRPFVAVSGCDISHSGNDISNPDVTSISFSSTVYEGIVDAVNKKLTSRYALFTLPTLPSTETIRESTASGTGKWVRYNLPSNATAKDAEVCAIGEKIHGIERASTAYRAAWDAQVYTGGANYYLSVFVPSDFTTVEQVNELIAGSKVLYKLSSPVVSNLANVPEFTTRLGANNIWADCGDVTVKYPMDIQSYFDGATKTASSVIAWEQGTIDSSTGEKDSDNSTSATKITRIRSFLSIRPLSEIGYLDIKPGCKFTVREYDRYGNFIATLLGWTNASQYLKFDIAHNYRFVAAFDDDRPILPEEAPLTLTFTTAFDAVAEKEYFDRLERNPLYQARYSDSERKSFTLVHFSDIHAGLYAMHDIQDFCDRNYSSIDDIINTGDLVHEAAMVTANGNPVEPFSPDASYAVGDFLTYGGYLYKVTKAFSGTMRLSGYCAYWGRLKHENSVNAYFQMPLGQKALFVIGNHDTNIRNFTAANTSTNDYKAMEKAEALTRYFANIDEWGVVRPSADVCYYYKDYATQKIRLICLDVQFWDSDELAWLETTLAGAKTAGYGVVIAAHCIPDAVTGYTETNFTSYVYPDSNSSYSSFGRYTNGAAVPAIESFMNDGGEFICWMCGHNHRNRFTKCTNSPNITVVQIENAGNFNSSLHENERTGLGCFSRTCANAVSFNTSDKLIKIVRIGTNMDSHMRKADYLCFDYATRQVIV